HVVKSNMEGCAAPADYYRVAAHHPGSSPRLKRVRKPFHVAVIIATFDEKFQEPADRHVCDGIEVIELDTMLGSQLPPKLCFDCILFRRQECADRGVDQIQDKPAVWHTIAQAVE